MKLGTKLTLSLSLIIIVVLSGYGYFHILSRRDILIRKMKVEVKSIGWTLKVALEKAVLQKEVTFIQELIDVVSESEQTLGVAVYLQPLQDKDLLLSSRSLEADFDSLLRLIKNSIRENHPQEEFSVYKKTPIFSYAIPLKDKKGETIGGVSILQRTSFVEEDIKKAEWSILITILIMIGGTLALVHFSTRKWITEPISQLMGGIKNMAKGNLQTRIELKRGDELSELGHAFNQMAGDLKEAQDRIIEEAETKLRLERDLRQSEKLAAIGQLASGLAHEIGTPLNIISGRVELAKRKLDDKEGVQKNLDIVIQQTERITKIIQRLLGFVRKKKPEQRNLNITALLETTLDFLDHEIQKQKVKVVRETEDPLPSVMGDPDQLQQVFLNIVLNAVQSMPEGGTLHLSASTQVTSKEGLEDGKRRYVEVKVQDTGMGMEREVMDNIFNPFFTTKEKDKGTGLGLTVSQGIVQDHEGWIELESETGKGSLFKIYLPSYQGER
ncbi:MAG: HAMP domain-containing protein [Syntrophaceae bacterium]|nr:HAMP domain-containing protein [Syntrophaceae bacterium]